MSLERNYIGPLEIRCLVNSERLLKTLEADNRDESLGIVALKGLVLVHPSTRQDMRLFSEEADPFFEVQKIRRETILKNSVAELNDEGYADKSRQDKISALGHFKGWTFGSTVIGEGKVIDPDHADLQIYHTDPHSLFWPGQVHIPIWESASSAKK